MINEEQIYEILKSKGFLKEEFIILSGASLVLQGIKDFTNDIDIAVSRTYLNFLLNNYQCEIEFYNKEENFYVYYIDDIINFSTNYNNAPYIIKNGYKVQTLESIVNFTVSSLVLLKNPSH